MNEYCFNDHIVKKLINKYGGSERKETIVLDDGYEYLLKLPDPTREKKRMLSYINNSISEYIGCKIMEKLKLSVQKVILGEYTTISSTGEKRKYIACACRNIEHDGYSLAEAERTTLGSDENTRKGVLPSFETIEEIAKYTSDISLQEIETFYSEMFIGDAFIGNKDRHNGNWGFLTGIKGSQIAPIYDCGSSLCPMYEDSQLTESIAINEANNGRSVIKDVNGKQIVYKDYLLAADNNNINNALKKIISRIHFDEIIKIVEETPYISEVRKQFYEKFLNEKYQKILLPALEQVHDKEIVYDERTCTAEELYQNYINILKPMSEVPVDKTVPLMINEVDKIGIRASTKYFIIINSETEKSEAIISVRSNNSESWKSLQILAKTYNTDINHLSITIKDEN